MYTTVDMLTSIQPLYLHNNIISIINTRLIYYFIIFAFNFAVPRLLSIVLQLPPAVVKHEHSLLSCLNQQLFNNTRNVNSALTDNFVYTTTGNV